MKYVLTTQAGLESVAKKEISRIGGTIIEVQDRLITFEGDDRLCIKANLWSRVGNKVYIVLDEVENVTDFDSYFDIVTKVDLKKYFKRNHPITVKAVSTRSELFATRTLQSLGKKAIVESLVGKNGKYEENEQFETLEILAMIIDNKLRLLLDTTGQGLHKRGYRTEAGEAPIKENLAAGIVLLSGWRFKENFYDPFCGSGTFAIEALMIAKNIAPGLHRYFSFENFDFITKDILTEEKEAAKKLQYNDDYNIFASDIDPEVIDIAKQNAKNAGLEGMINFSVKDIRDYIDKSLVGTLVTNPPYGERLQPEDIKSIYNTIDKLFRINENLKGGLISSYMEFDNLVAPKTYKKRKLYNGGEMCYFWKRL